MNESTRLILSRTLFALLILWGGYVTLNYFGVPVHQSAMIDDAGRTLGVNACGANSGLCAGFFAVFTSIVTLFNTMSPFFGYAIVCALVLAGFATRTYMRSQEWNLRVTLSPLLVIGLLALAAWAMLMSIGFSGNGGLSMSQVVEPTTQVYPDVSAEGLADLRENFDDLRERGCLSPTQFNLNGAPVYRYSFGCMQIGFFTRVLPQMLLLLLLAFNVLVLGRAVLHGLRLKGFTPLVEGVFSAGIGSCVLIAILWLVAMVGFYTQTAGWALLIGIPAAGFVHSVHWARTFWAEKWEVDMRPYDLTLIVAWLLASFLILNFLNVVRPFPIGWDDLGRYLNQPRLLVSYGSFIATLPTFSWEYMTSLGFLLFGFDSVFGATLSMLINWAAGLLAVGAVWIFGRTYLGAGKGLLAALLYYSLPMVGHFSFADMKVDNAIFAMGALSALAAFLAVCPPPENDEEEGDSDGVPVLLLLALAGGLAGFAFGMKPTAIMLITAVGAVMVGRRLGWAGFLGTAFLSWILFVRQGTFNVAEVSGRVFGDATLLSPFLVTAVCAILGLGLLAYAAHDKLSVIRPLATQAGLFVVGFVVTIVPWIVTNNASFGNLPLRLELSHANPLSTALILDDSAPPDIGVIKTLPPDLQLDRSNPACVSTSKEEELDRYWGDYAGPWHYLGLPWRAVMNTDTFGYYVTLAPMLLLFPLLLLVPAFWSRGNKWMRLLFGATVFMVVQWMFFANGIVWYGIVAFLGLALLVEAIAVRAPSKSTRIVTGVLIALSLVTSFAHRMWQFETMQNIFEYSLGKVTASAMEERTIPHYDDIRESIEARRAATPERPYTYRMGTFIPYFIPRNFEVLPVADNQLDMFNCLYQERDAAKTLARLQALGFNSMIFDMNTQTIERDPQGSLHKKVEAFVDFANRQDLGIDIVLNDPDAGIAYILLP